MLSLRWLGIYETNKVIVCMRSLVSMSLCAPTSVWETYYIFPFVHEHARAPACACTHVCARNHALVFQKYMYGFFFNYCLTRKIFDDSVDSTCPPPDVWCIYILITKWLYLSHSTHLLYTSSIYLPTNGASDALTNRLALEEPTTFFLFLIDPPKHNSRNRRFLIH